MEIKRSILGQVRNHLDAKEITLLVGARQAGKTTLLRQLMEEKRSTGERCLFFNLDYEPDFALFSSQEKLLRQIELASGGEKAFVFIDEIQRKKNAGLFLKGIYDQLLPHKFIITGSGSLELKEQIHESLVGRKRVFELETVTFREFAAYQTNYAYPGDRLPDYLDLQPERAELLLLDYLNFGGYPRVVTAAAATEKTAVLREIYQSYIEKDIRLLLQIEKSRAFTTMIRLLALRTGKTIDYSSLSRDAGLSFQTLKKYLWYAEKTFVLELLPPFFRNQEKEIAKSPQVYFKDLGLKNIAIEKAGRIQALNEAGFEFQHFAYRLLRSYIGQQLFSLHFWRTKSQAEVDFVIDRGQDLLPVEIKAQALTKPAVSRSLRSFINKYQPREAWLINLSLDTSIRIGSTTVFFRPWYRVI